MVLLGFLLGLAELLFQIRLFLRGDIVISSSTSVSDDALSASCTFFSSSFSITIFFLFAIGSCVSWFV